MGKWIYVIIVLCAFAALAVIALLIKLYRTIAAGWDAQNILKTGRERSSFLHELALTAFPASAVMHDVLLPTGMRNGRPCAIKVELLVVTRGGIVVVSSCKRSGHIDNPYKGDWTCYTQTGNEKFRNPLEINSLRMRAVENVLKSNEIYNIPLHSIVVLCDSRTKTRIRNKSLIYSEQMILHIKNIARSRFVTSSEVRKVCIALSKRSDSSAVRKSDNERQ